MVMLRKPRKPAPNVVVPPPETSAESSEEQRRETVANISNANAKNKSSTYIPVATRKPRGSTTPGPSDGQSKDKDRNARTSAVVSDDDGDSTASEPEEAPVEGNRSKSKATSKPAPSDKGSKKTSAVTTTRKNIRDEDSTSEESSIEDHRSKSKATSKSVSLNKGPKKSAAGCTSRKVIADEDMELDDSDDDDGDFEEDRQKDKRKPEASKATANAKNGKVPLNSDSKNKSKKSATPEPLSPPLPVARSKGNAGKQRVPVNAGDSDDFSSADEFIASQPAANATNASTIVSSASSQSSKLSAPLSSGRGRARIEEMDVEEGSESSLNQSVHSSLRARRRSGSMLSGEANSAAPTASVVDSSYDPNDPDWLKFANSVKEAPASAHERLSLDLLESSNCSALLGKLIFRSVLGESNTSSESRGLCKKYCVTIIRAILHLSIQNEHNSGVVVDLVNMLFTELRHFPTAALQNITEYCLDYMKRNKDGSFPPRWIEVFGKLVSVMITRGDIKKETDVMDGKAYREYIITEICSSRLNWTTENTASLVAVIREIPGLDDAELKVLFHHIRTCLIKVKASALPPIVHQLILLAGSRCPSELLAVCAEYFEKVNFGNTDSVEVRQKRNALGTVVFHFLESARHCDVLLKAVLKVVKASFFDFGKVMSPFMLSVVLGLTTYEHAKAAIIDPLRNSVMKSFHSLQLSETSYWYRHKVGDAEDTVTQCFKAVLETKSSELELMFDGLRDLGIGLLNADLYQVKYPNTLERCQILGSYLITSLVKSCPDQLPSMMKHLLKVSTRSLVHTECLAKCLEMRTRQIIHPSIIGTTCEIIRHLPMMESAAAAMIVKALANALNLSYILLDQLMLNLRKTIWKSVEARRTAAKIMIILLSNSRVVGDVPFSQYSESQRFYNDSQNQQQSSSNGNGQLPDNQPLCIEILTLTKRCFTQQCEIREELYLGFHSVVRKNPGLCELICSHLYNHTSQYLSESLDTTDANADVSSILLGKVVELPAIGNNNYAPITIKEELGFLVQCLSFVVHKSHQAFHNIDDGPPAAVEQLEGLLQRWIKAILKLTPNNIEVAAADAVARAGGSRPLDNVRYVETLFTIQVMQVIEALIEFLNLENKPRNDRTVKKLFERFAFIEPLLRKEKEKVAAKKGKGDKTKAKKGGKDKDATDAEVTVVDDASETSENQAPGVKFKKPDAPKRLSYFHILTLETTLELLRNLQKSNDDKGVVRMLDGEDFEKFILSAVKQKLNNFKRKESLRERSRPSLKISQTFADVAGCIWNSLLMHNPDDEDGHVTVTTELMELRLEIVNEIVTLLCSSYPSVCCHLIKAFSDDDSEDSYDAVFLKFFNSWKTVHGWLPSTADGDNTGHQYLFDILHAFAKPLSPDSADQSNSKASEVLNWVWQYMSSQSGKKGKAEFLLAESAVSCWLTYYMKGKDFLEQPGKRHHDVLTLAIGVKQLLGFGNEVDTQYLEEDPSNVRMWIINDDTAPTILCAIMNHLEVILSHIMAILSKLKSNQNDDTLTQDKIGLLRGDCFVKIEEIVKVCSQLVISQFPACLCCSTMLKIVPQIFTVMTGYGEYFFELIKAKRPYSLKGFAKPVAKIGKNFKPLVEGMINHVERVQREYADDVYKKAVANKKNKGAAKVPQSVKNQLLKEKRLIPNFVYIIEKYDQLIIALSKKSDKHKLLVGMKLSTARDFKIDSTKLADAMNNRTRSVQELTTVPDEESNMEVEAMDNTTAAGPSRSRAAAAPRTRKARKRKTTESERDEETGNDE